MDVGVLLGDDLRDQHGIRSDLARRVDQFGHEHLGAEVVHRHLAVVLQPLLPREPLDVEDRVDPHRVGVGADARTDDDELAAQPLADLGVGVAGGQQRELPLVDDDVAHVDEVGDRPVDDEEREVRAHRLGVHEQRRLEPHLGRELERGTLGTLVVRQGQGEGHLHHAVAGRVAVGAHDRAGLRQARLAGKGVLHAALGTVAAAAAAGLLGLGAGHRVSPVSRRSVAGLR